MTPKETMRPASACAPGAENRSRTPGAWCSLLAGLVAALALSAAGCRGGLKTFSAPKWPGLGDAKAKAAEPPMLAAAPTSSGPIEKPSAGASPYPTSSTPAGYVVADPGTAGASPGVIQTAATDPPSVTYGVTPAMPDPVRDTPAPPMTTVEASSPIAPQVGPYA